MKKILTLLLVLFAATTGYSQVVISQVYARGGSATSYYQHDYVVLHNTSPTASVNISNYTIQRRAAGAGGFTLEYTIGASVTIPKGGYYLITSDAQSGVNPVPTTADAVATGKLTLGAGGGTVALVSNNTILTDCTTDCITQNPNLVDLVGWGSAKAYLGTATAAFATSSSMVASRKNSGCDNSGDNSSDFEQLDVSTGTNAPKNSASTIDLCNAAPLNLTSFSVQKAGSNVQINWSTAQEQNSKNFEVQRSTDQNNWSTVATVAATGSSNTTANYSATDYSPAQGVNYYRLKIVDADNSYTMSEVKSVNFASGFAVSISPNPASTYINVTLGGNGSSRVIMSDLNGKVVYNQTTTAPKLQINSSTFAKGMYIIKVVNGSDISTNKVIVQ